MTNEQEVVRSVFGAYINDLKSYSTKPDRLTYKMLEEVRDMAIKALEDKGYEQGYADGWADCLEVNADE